MSVPLSVFLSLCMFLSLYLFLFLTLFPNPILVCLHINYSPVYCGGQTGTGFQFLWICATDYKATGWGNCSQGALNKGIMKWFVLYVQKRLPLCEKVSVVTAGAWLLSASRICPHHGLAQYFKGGRKGGTIFSLYRQEREKMVLISQFDLFSITPACHMRENAEQVKSISAFEEHWGWGGVFCPTAAPEDTNHWRALCTLCMQVKELRIPWWVWGFLSLSPCFSFLCFFPIV